MMRMNKFFLLDDGDICFIPDQHAEFDFYRASSLEQHHTCISMKDKHATLLGLIILTPYVAKYNTDNAL